MNVTIVDYNSGNISSVINTFNEVAKNTFHSFIATFLLVALGLLAAFAASLIIDKNFFTLLLSYCPGGIYEVAVIAIFFNFAN